MITPMEARTLGIIASPAPQAPTAHHPEATNAPKNNPNTALFMRRI